MARQTSTAKTVKASAEQAKKKQQQDKAEQAKKKQRREALKARVFDMEQANNNRLIAYADGTGWYKLGGHSALIYRYRVAKRLKLKPRLNPDTDFYSRFKEGTVSIRQIETLENNLKTLKIYRNSKLTTPGELYVFDLGYKISDEDFDLMYRDEQIRRDNFNKMVLPKVSYPEIHVSLMNILKLCRPRIMKMSVVDRALYGEEINEILLRACEQFFFMANGHKKEELALKEIFVMMEKLKCYMKVCMELEVWPVENATMVAAELVKINRIIQKRIREIEKNTRTATKVTPVRGS